MPTGGSETAADRTLGGLIKDNQQTASQLNRRQKRSRCAGPLQMSVFHSPSNIRFLLLQAGRAGRI
jgi:hypothetical protein